MTNKNRLFNEPVLIASAIRAVLLAAVAFGVTLTSEQIAAGMVAVEAVLLVATRALVTPNRLAEHRVRMGGSPTQSLRAAREARHSGRRRPKPAPPVVPPPNGAA